MDNTYAGDLKLVGGRLCLDFTNTADWHAGSNPVDHIRNYDDLVVWAEHAEIVTEDQARRLRPNRRLRLTVVLSHYAKRCSAYFQHWQRTIS
jgi:hypothetical protein